MDVKRTRRVGVAAVVAALVWTTAAVSWTAAAPPAPLGAAPSAAPDGAPSPAAIDPTSWSDYDDDGFRDLAVGAPDASVQTPGGIIGGAGKVFVLYGTADGLSTDRAQEWHLGTPGILSSPGTNDRFGAALASGDFDRDGVADLAIGVPGKNRFIGGAVRSDAGMVEVIFGTAGIGLTAADDIAMSPTTGGLGSPAQDLKWSDSEFGAALVAFDRFDMVAPVNQAPDGFADLAIGAPGFNGGAGLYAALPGDNFASDPVFQEFQDFGQSPMPEPDGASPSRAASSLAAGDFDGEGFDDVAIGCPLCDVDDGDDVHANAGMILVASRELPFHFLFEGDGDNLNLPESHDAFGSAMAAGDFTGNGIDELAVGAPGKDLAGHLITGQVQIYTGHADTGPLGRPQGLGGPIRNFDEGSSAVISEPVTLERFGQTLAAGNFGRGGGIDLAIGALREKVGSVSGAGAVFVLYNTGTALSANNSQRWTQDIASIPNASETNDQFGRALAVGQFGRGGALDLVIGVDLEDLPGDNTFANAGMIHVLYGSGNGLRATNDQRFDMGSPGLPGLDKDSRFGGALR